MANPGSDQVARAANLTQRPRLRAVVCALAIVVCVTLTGGVARASASTPAGPAVAPDRPPVLMLGGGLGDSQFLVTHWLGDAVQEVATEGSLALLTSATPGWWSGDAPDTYVLAQAQGAAASSGEVYTVADLVWALDRLAERHPVGRSVLVCQGASGLMAREYLEDLADPKQSARADVIGLVTIGTPHQGLSLLAAYPDVDVWGPYAAGGGRTPADLAPDSAYIQSLNSGALPSVVKVLAIRGACAALTAEVSDGVATIGEQVPVAAVVPGVLETPVDVRARASDVWPLTTSWFPQTKKGGATSNQVDGSEMDNLEVVRGYATMVEVQQAVKTFYTTWFAADVPVTHISSRLVVDTSGSMKKAFEGVTRIAAAQQACATFADAMTARKDMGGGVPEDIALITFDTTAQVAAGPTDDAAAVKAVVEGLAAEGDFTDIGRALEAAVESFSTSPNVARKLIIFVSDGKTDTEEGMDNAAILAGPVAVAAQRGIAINTVGAGELEVEHQAFLQEISATTGGSFTQALSPYELARDFLRARYASLGSLVVDSEVELQDAMPVTIDLVQVGDDGRLVEIGLIPERAVEWRLLRDGAPVAADEVKQKASSGGALALAVEYPTPGAYALEVQMASGAGEGRAQAFAVYQQDVFRVEGTPAMPDSRAGFWLIVIGAVGALALVLAVALSLRRPEERVVAESVGDEQADDPFDQPPDEPEQGE